MTGPRQLLILILLALFTWLILWWLTDITRRGFDHDATPAVVDVSLPKPRPTTTTTSTTLPPTTTTTARARTAPTVRAASASRPTVTGDVWHALAMCETGGKMNNPNTGNGYFGFFQFSLRTWRSVGGPGYPHEHSYDVQKSYAQILQARSGWGQWPLCSRRLGLR